MKTKQKVWLAAGLGLAVLMLAGAARLYYPYWHIRALGAEMSSEAKLARDYMDRAVEAMHQDPWGPVGELKQRSEEHMARANALRKELCREAAALEGRRQAEDAGCPLE
jgi:hypothetical protein